MHSMANELCEVGLDIPGLKTFSDDTADPEFIPPEAHHHIGNTEKNAVDLAGWQAANPHDPAVQTFVSLLKGHLRERLCETFPSLMDEDVPVIIRHDRVYEHAMAHFNYTSYDLQRDQDIIHPSAQKTDVMVSNPASSQGASLYPWTYARVLGIYHVNVLIPGEAKYQREELLHVRWLQNDPAHIGGDQARRLDRIQFVPYDSGNAFGFVDPAQIIRACHLIPAFHHGRTRDYLPASPLARDPEGDWRFFYVNRFVDRDMFVRHIGCGIGHFTGVRANATSSIKPADFDSDLYANPVLGTRDLIPLQDPGESAAAVDGLDNGGDTDETFGHNISVEDDGLDDGDLLRSLFPPASATTSISTVYAMPPLASIPLPNCSNTSTSTVPSPGAIPSIAREGNPSSHPRRPRANSMNSASDGEQHSEPDPPQKKRRRRNMDETPLMAVGVAVGLMGDLFRDFQSILSIGINASASHSPQTALSYRERKYRALFNQILALAPWIVDEVAKHGPRGPVLLEDGRRGVRGVDLHGIKKAVLTWNKYEPVIPSDAKSVRGFNHPECGRLLCPVRYDWNDPVIRRALQNRHKDCPCGATEWPVLLWENENINQEQMHEGFLRNARLVKAGRHVLLGPRTASSSGGKPAAKKPKARIYGIRSITIGFMAYTAILASSHPACNHGQICSLTDTPGQVHCSLNSQETFNDGSIPGTFPYERFYQNIVRYVEEEFFEDEREDLLTWWNEQIFEGQYEDEGFEGRQVTADGDTSVMGIMRAQAAARRR
ncbi:hypothetical protein NUW54_g8000 [Trametes sanguinea]|uniref:Uncharacterized protein n=1 Tax=Trametes sanguinea TaxID=158606 RepID=A0ACC1PHT3_9APHY|nr:hypothetical protein NUW54_g8000 [Trametes sanguinea]